MKRHYLFQQFVLTMALLVVSNLWSQVSTYVYTGAVQTYTVPAGVTSIQIETWGAEGGTGTYGGITPIAGLGGYAIGNLTVVPGQVLEVYVGGHGNSTGPGGFNGGGMAGSQYGASGGGASDVRIAPYGLTERVIVAGGGGGAAYGSSPNDGGNGGGLVGSDGATGGGFTGGGGGTQVAGGAAGCCYGAATSGGFGFGGGPGDYHNAGGGGGWYGGGSGAGQAGAGGGSSYIDGVTSGSTTGGIRTGDGQVVITVLCSAIPITVSDNEICLGDSVTLNATGSGTLSWDAGVVNNVPFAPATAGSFIYTVSSTNSTECTTTVTVDVNPLPLVTASVNDTIICFGDSVTFSGGGADSYLWDIAGITNGVPYAPAAGTATYTVTGIETATGCSNTSQVVVVTHALPNVVASADDNEICLGQSITLTGSGASSYQWLPVTVSNGIAFLPDTTGLYDYEVTGTDSNGCVNSASIIFNVYDSLEITYTTVNEIFGLDGSINITVTGGNPTYTFDWDNDGTGDFNDSEDLTGLVGGTYVVVVQDQAGCTINETVIVNSQVGLSTIETLSVSIYPNPAQDYLTVTLDGNFDYQFLTLEGKVLASGQAFDQKIISMNGFTSGVYLLHITSEGKDATVKVLVK